MRVGRFRDGHPRLTLTLQGAMSNVDIEFVIDTGFNGDLVIPRDLIGLIAHRFVGYNDQIFADGRLEKLPFHETVIDWDEEERVVELLILDGEPLIGTSLLADLLLTVEISEGGDVALESL